MPVTEIPQLPKRGRDGHKLRRYTFAWLHSHRRTVPRFEKSIRRFDGFVSLACASIALNRLL